MAPHQQRSKQVATSPPTPFVTRARRSPLISGSGLDTGEGGPMAPGALVLIPAGVAHLRSTRPPVPPATTVEREFPSLGLGESVHGQRAHMRRQMKHHIG